MTLWVPALSRPGESAEGPDELTSQASRYLSRPDRANSHRPGRSASGRKSFDTLALTIGWAATTANRVAECCTLLTEHVGVQPSVASAAVPSNASDRAEYPALPSASCSMKVGRSGMSDGS